MPQSKERHAEYVRQQRKAARQADSETPAQDLDAIAEPYHEPFPEPGSGTPVTEDGHDYMVVKSGEGLGARVTVTCMACGGTSSDGPVVHRALCDPLAALGPPAVTIVDLDRGRHGLTSGTPVTGQAVPVDPDGLSEEDRRRPIEPLKGMVVTHVAWGLGVWCAGCGAMSLASETSMDHEEGCPVLAGAKVGMVPYPPGHVHSFKPAEEGVECRECGWRGPKGSNIYTDGLPDWPKLISNVSTKAQAQLLERFPRTKART